jgi:choline kinase
MLDHFMACGVDAVTIVTGYREEQIASAVSEWGLPLSVRLVRNDAFDRTNNAASLLCARKEVDGREFILLDGDVVFERAVLDLIVHSAQPDIVALRPADELSAEEVKCQVDGTGRVLRIGKDIPPAEAAGESIGIERFSPVASRALFETLEERISKQGLVNEWYESSFQQMIDQGVALYALSVGRLCCAEIDTPDDLRAADLLMRDCERHGSTES